MEINYTVKLLLPAITASLGTIGKDTDIEIKKDSRGNPFFSAKHIKGILRERVSQFKLALGENEKDFIKKYFGDEGDCFEENRFSKINFSNLVLNGDSKNIEIDERYGIRVDRRTKTTIPQSLFSYQFLNKDNIFEGKILVENTNEKDLKFILACLFHLDSIGGLKSRGLGKVEVMIEGKIFRS